MVNDFPPVSEHADSGPDLTIALDWSGPYDWGEVIKRFNDGGAPPLYDGPDYGLYQIYGKHILNGSNTLLYIGRATQQTFSARFRGHREWLVSEDKFEKTQIFLGRIYDRERHLSENDWKVWIRDVEIAECLLIHKYSPNYNSVSIAEPPPLGPYRKVILENLGHPHRLSPKDVGPDDWI